MVVASLKLHEISEIVEKKFGKMLFYEILEVLGM